MKRGQVFVRAQDPNGKWGNADVLDLDDDSFKAFVVSQLIQAGFVVGLHPQFVEGDEITYKCETPFVEGE